MVRKRRERRRGKHSAADEAEVVGQEDEQEVEADPEPEPEPAPEPEPEPAMAIGAEGESVPEGATGAEPVHAELPDEADGAAATASPSAPIGAVTEELESLTKLLEQSLGGSSQGPVPNVSSTWTADEALPPPPQINATPEDILGVQAQHRDSQDEPAQESAERPEPAAPLPGSGTGAKPMEAFEERAQMAKEVLRATGNNPRGLRSDEQGSDAGPRTEPVGQDEPEPEEERNEDVRFSEDLTISSKRRRRLFGR
jgi:hypothetical protein